MRIHRLEIQAFGPFAERQHIDFDALTEQGLFLLNGPTGAGKSSVLDAICYALYGSVPGARQSAKRLRSDHAPDTLIPEVVCEFSAGTRRLEVTRNPAWQRPSKRGAGTTPEQARTLLRERAEGEWVTRSTRNDEAGAELQALLGMNREQFTRVVMLPQGEFAAFLRSDAATRGELLQRLFATDRFSTVEQLLAEHASAAAARRQEAEAELDAVLTRATEEVQRHGIRLSSDRELSSDAETEAASQPAPEGNDSEPGLRQLQEALESAVLQGRERVSELKVLRIAAGEERNALEIERANRMSYRQLVVEAERNRGDLLEAARLKEQLQAHRRAQMLEGPLRARDQTAEDARLREEDLQIALAVLRRDSASANTLPEVEDLIANGRLQTFERTHRMVREKLAAAQAALPQEQELTNLQARIRDGRQRLNNHAAESAQLGAVQEDKAAQLAQTVVLLEAAGKSANHAAQLADKCAEMTSQLSLTAQATAAEESLLKLVDLEQVRRAHFLKAKENWLEKLQLRLEQAAAELAARLNEGDACPVCGSEEHPAPATVHDQTLVTLEEEEQARSDQDLAEQELLETSTARDAAAIEAAGLRARGGEADPEEIRAGLRTLQVELGEAEQAAQRLPNLTEKKTLLEDELSDLEFQQAEVARREVEESSLVAALQEQADALASRVESARAGYRSVEERVVAVSRVEDHLGAVCFALTQLEQANNALANADEVLHTGLIESEFESPEGVRGALLTEERTSESEAAIRNADNAAHRIERDMREPGNVSAAAMEAEGRPVPETKQILEAAQLEEDAAKALEQAVLEAGLLEQSVIQLDSYADRARVLEQRLTPLRGAHELAKSLADTARGNGENLYRMSLATYVLAARLEQVADAATERLQQMSDGRYSLVHSDAKSGNKKSGLGLNVIDSWTGMRRDTATLSGGESFMASLALALGLADVVQQESGGLDIETLFVDEGFGSLDEQSLEQVMDALENLRDGGRVVGLVSHVPELKQRIPAQLHVLKGRSGSTLRFVDQLQRV